MRCPNCGGRTVVQGTRKRAPGWLVYRRRRCRRCHYEFSTHEKVAPGVSRDVAARQRIWGVRFFPDAAKKSTAPARRTYYQ